MATVLPSPVGEVDNRAVSGLQLRPACMPVKHLGQVARIWHAGVRPPILKATTMRSLLARTALTVLLGATGIAQAALITTAPGGATVVDFSQFGSPQAIVGAIEVGALVGESISLTAQDDNRVGPMAHGLGANGNWSRSGVLNNEPTDGWFAFTFNAGPVASVGGFMNYAGPDSTYSAQTLIEALDAMGNVIESYDLFSAASISTPGGLNAGAFRGISRATNDIYGFRVSYNYAVLDDLSFSRVNAVPEPGALALLGLALLAAGRVSRRR